MCRIPVHKVFNNAFALYNNMSVVCSRKRKGGIVQDEVEGSRQIEWSLSGQHLPETGKCNGLSTLFPLSLYFSS